MTESTNTQKEKSFRFHADFRYQVATLVETSLAIFIAILFFFLLTFRVRHEN
jgi:hypothetical protein